MVPNFIITECDSLPIHSPYICVCKQTLAAPTVLRNSIKDNLFSNITFDSSIWGDPRQLDPEDLKLPAYLLQIPKSKVTLDGGSKENGALQIVLRVSSDAKVALN